MKIYQKCPKCNYSIRIPKKKVEFDGTPFYRWEFANEVECPNCTKQHKLDPSTFFLPTKVKIENPPSIKTKEGTLYAFDIGLPPLKQRLKERFNLNLYEKDEYSKEDNYVAIYSDKLIFSQEIFPWTWEDRKNAEPPQRYRGNEYCCVYTNVNFDGTIETGITT